MTLSARPVAVDRAAARAFRTARPVLLLDEAPTDAEVAAFVVGSASALAQALARARRTQPPVPVVFLDRERSGACASHESVVAIDPSVAGADEIGETVEALARRFEDEELPPFFAALYGYVAKRNTTFACPGHQGSGFLETHPVGRRFVEFVGRGIYAMDVPHADPMLGDMTGREGPPAEAEARAARAFGADRTYFVLNGTSTANKVVASALLTPDDWVLFDRNNHKSCYNGMLALSGARPLYLETTRNTFGLIGGVPARCFDEAYLRERLRAVDPARAAAERPFRLAAFQLGTWDGTLYNVRKIVARVGHLCDYILFDAAWVGYEQFVPLLDGASPLRMRLDATSPGIVVTQSVHKQMAGFSQTSQIHVRDAHLDARTRRTSEAAFAAALMIHGTTSPFYPLFASLDVNARLHEAVGTRIWGEVVETGIEIRKAILARCRLVRPFVPPRVDGEAWENAPTSVIARDPRFFLFGEDEPWHGFRGYGGDIQSLDPCKLLLVTGTIPAGVVAAYLREQGLIPEKSDLYSLVFLLTPGTARESLDRLVDGLCRFEADYGRDAPVHAVLPAAAARAQDLGAAGLAGLCSALHQLYVETDLARLLGRMFEDAHLPKPVLSVRDAHHRYVRGDFERIRLADARGRIAAEGALPYPPGIFCIAPGETWDGPVLDYFLAIERLLDAAPDFAPFYHGVHTEEDDVGRTVLKVHVLS